MKHSYSKIQHFFGILAKLQKNGLPVDRAQIIYDYTGGRTDSAADLSNMELEGLCEKLEKDLPQNPTRGHAPLANHPIIDQVNDKLRKKIISLGYQIGLEPAEIKEKVVVKWGKRFNSFDTGDLRKIIAVVEKEWLPFYLKKTE